MNCLRFRFVLTLDSFFLSAIKQIVLRFFYFSSFFFSIYSVFGLIYLWIKVNPKYSVVENKREKLLFNFRWYTKYPFVYLPIFLRLRLCLYLAIFIFLIYIMALSTRINGSGYGYFYQLSFTCLLIWTEQALICRLPNQFYWK